ncbi:hypothetical protein CRYUN_Cryun30bG0007200 [Craigia yunnanensis]
MSNESEYAQVRSSAAVKSHAGSCDAVLRLLNHAVQSLLITSSRIFCLMGYVQDASHGYLVPTNIFIVTYAKKKKYESEPWFEIRLLYKCVSVKDVLKFAITKPLETLLDAKSRASSFPIRTENGLQKVNDESVVADNDCSDYSTIETNTFIGRSLNGLQDQEPSERFGFPIEKVVFYDIF